MIRSRSNQARKKPLYRIGITTIVGGKEICALSWPYFKKWWFISQKKRRKKYEKNEMILTWFYHFEQKYSSQNWRHTAGGLQVTPPHTHIYKVYVYKFKSSMYILSKMYIMQVDTTTYFFLKKSSYLWYVMTSILCNNYNTIFFFDLSINVIA